LWFSLLRHGLPGISIPKRSALTSKNAKNAGGLGLFGGFHFFTSYRFVAILPVTPARHQMMPSIKHFAVLIQPEALADRLSASPAPSLGFDIG
jgi:hypothetical protein